MPSFSIPSGVVAGVSLAATAASTAVGVLGSIQQGKAAQDQANYQAQVAANNQKIAAQNAAYASQAGQADVARQGLANRARMGSIRAGEAAAGVDVDSGSNIDLRTSEREAGLGDVGQTERNAALRIYGYQSQGTNFQAQSGLYSAEASNAAAAIPFQTTTGLLGGVSSLADKYSKFQTAGVFGS